MEEVKCLDCEKTLDCSGDFGEGWEVWALSRKTGYSQFVGNVCDECHIKNGELYIEQFYIGE